MSAETVVYETCSGCGDDLGRAYSYEVWCWGCQFDASDGYTEPEEE